jgi:hypothetical protein
MSPFYALSVPWTGLLLAALVSGCSGRAPPPTSEPPPQSVTTIEAAPAVFDAGGEDPVRVAMARKDSKRRGVGWYPQIEVTTDNRLALAWVDADRGDVRYALTAAGGSALEGDAVVVDSEGACGGFLRLALAPGNAPIFSYVRQDKQLLRVAWRAADRVAMKDAGADVDVSPLPALPPANNAGTPVSVGQGFIAEEIGFGEQVGRGSALAVDAKGRFVLAYYAADDRLRLARRPTDLPAFGPESTGVLEKRDVDSARGSVRIVSSLVVLPDETLVASYADDVVTDARLRVAILRPGADRFVVVKDDDGPAITLDGLVSSLSWRTSGPGSPLTVDVVALDKSERALFLRTIDVEAGAFVGERRRLVDIDGTAVVARSLDGFVALARIRGEGGGVFLYLIEERALDGGRVTFQSRRIRLGSGGDQDDSWLDVVVRPDGRPAAVWYDAELLGLRLYAP